MKSIASQYIAAAVCVICLLMVRSSLEDISGTFEQKVRVAVTEAVAGRADIVSWTKTGTSPDGDVIINTVQGRPDPSHQSVPSNESEADALVRHRERIAAVEALYTSGLTWTN